MACTHIKAAAVCIFIWDCIYCESCARTLVRRVLLLSDMPVGRVIGRQQQLIHADSRAIAKHAVVETERHIAKQLRLRLYSTQQHDSTWLGIGWRILNNWRVAIGCVFRRRITALYALLLVPNRFDVDGFSNSLLLALRTFIRTIKYVKGSVYFPMTVCFSPNFMLVFIVCFRLRLSFIWIMCLLLVWYECSVCFRWKRAFCTIFAPFFCFRLTQRDTCVSWRNVMCSGHTFFRCL